MARLTPSRIPAVVVSCEHASNRVPARYAALGLSVEALASHIAWDIGAADVARVFSRHLRRKLHCELHEARWSRLLVDLNRSARHRKLIAESSFGTEVPGNRGLDAAERDRRIRAYWLPYRTAVEGSVTAAIARAGLCVHLSVHSFTPTVAGRVRDADVGILYDPRRNREADLARRWARGLAASGLRARFNYPYRGTADGLTKALRERFADAAYCGLELELNQRILVDRTGAAHIAGVTSTAFLAILLSSEHNAAR